MGGNLVLYYNSYLNLDSVIWVKSTEILKSPVLRIALWLDIYMKGYSLGFYFIKTALIFGETGREIAQKRHEELWKHWQG